MLWSGPEVEKEDYILAHKWINLSISNFDARTQSTAINSAKKTRSEIEKELTPSQLEEAQKLAKEWMESHSSGGEGEESAAKESTAKETVSENKNPYTLLADIEILDSYDEEVKKSLAKWQAFAP